MGPTGKAFIAQLRLVATFAEMTPYLTICQFGDGYTKGMTLPGIGDEIGTFVDAEKMLKEHQGETMFPYCKGLCLAGHEALAPIHFPNVCKVANKGRGRLMRRSLITDLLKTLYLTSQRSRGSYCASSHEEKDLEQQRHHGYQEVNPSFR